MLVGLIVALQGLPARERATLCIEFPTVTVLGAPARTAWIAIDAAVWDEPNGDLDDLDRRVAEAASRGPLCLRADAGGGIVSLLTRYQRLLDRRNDASRSPGFDAVLAAHRALHDLDRPLCRADYEHALDTWQWLLRLAPEASLALQAAALFHDVERIESEALVRVEQHAPSYQGFKDAHARRGAAITRAALARSGLTPGTLERIGALVEGHERPGDDPEGVLLNEADALSFFSLNSSGFLDYYGPEHTRRKIDYSLGRLRGETRGRLRQIRLRSDLAVLVRDADGSRGPASPA